jgi:hypothetical protein
MWPGGLAFATPMLVVSASIAAIVATTATTATNTHLRIAGFLSLMLTLC